MSRHTQITNREFAQRADCDASMASRLMSGHRLPGLELCERIGTAFDIDWNDLLVARGEGPEAFAALLQQRCSPRPPSQLATR